MEAELRELGLDDNEIKIYLTCLSSGGSKVSDIAKRARVLRTTAYGVLNSLIGKGLISVITKEGVSTYSAADPDKLVSILEEKRERVSSIVPSLKELMKVIPQNQSVQLFEGKEGIKTVTNDIVSYKNQTVLMVGTG